MNRKAILVALVASLAISMLLWNKLQTDKPPEIEAPVVQQPTILKKPVVVSTKRIAARTRLEPELVESAFAIKEVIASAAPEMALTNVASLTGRYTAVTLLPGDIMTPMRLFDESSVPNLARAIPPGRRAVSIAVSKVTSVGGFIQQGDFVDVIASFRPRNADPITKIVMQDILILAVGGRYEFDSSTASSSPSISASKVELVTLAVTPSQLERLMYLDNSATFRFVLKNPKDKGRRIVTKGATERIVMQDIGHIPANEMTEKTAQDSEETDTTQIVSQPMDDGKVEIMYGASSKREIYKYGGPAGTKFRQLKDYKLAAPSYNPSASQTPARQSRE
ncbi:MAG: Flp pilus assembly protein CpaB [Candidatus Rifleibacteriota bacterium]